MLSSAFIQQTDNHENQQISHHKLPKGLLWIVAMAENYPSSTQESMKMLKRGILNGIKIFSQIYF